MCIGIPMLVVRTDQEKPDAALGRLFQKLVDMKYVTPAEFALLTGGLRPKRPGAKGAPAVSAKGSKPAATKAPEKKGGAKAAAKASPKPAAKAKQAAKGRRG